MLNLGDEYTFSEENSCFHVAIKSTIGHREEQQDRAGFEISDREGLIVICDGMGGQEGGRIASEIGVCGFLEHYKAKSPLANPSEFLINTADRIDERIAALKKEDGTPLKAGSTLASVFIKERDLFWISAGDSRIFFLRGSEMARITKDHIYMNLLREQLENHAISQEEYDAEIPFGAGLVSFLGINGLPLIDANSSPFRLLAGDRIFICTDGLYRAFPDDEIQSVLTLCSDSESALETFEKRAEERSEAGARDNMTAAIITIKA